MTSVYCRNLGWLFEDLKQHFAAAGAAVSEEPLAHADRWLCIRSSEAHRSPDLGRTIVQVHCSHEPWIGSPTVLNKCGGFILTHPGQAEILVRMGVDFYGKPAMLRPIGAPRSFTVREEMPLTFTAGWVGRDSGPFKRIGLFVEALSYMARTVPADALLVGSQLEPAHHALLSAGVQSFLAPRGNAEPASVIPYRDWYHQMDALVITSSLEAGPLPLFEALACGVPVVATDCGWTSRFIRNGENGYLVPPVATEIIHALDSIRRDRRDFFQRRHDIARTVAGYVLEDWIDDCLQFTENVV